MQLYNSLSKKKEQFHQTVQEPLTLYVCGITPYDTTHLGHAFLYVFFDVIVRYLTHKGYAVTYTQNVTDIDDDILKRAKQEQRDWKELGKFWTDRFLHDLDALAVQRPTHYVKATDSMDKIIEITEKLIQKGHAYEKDGNVYFSIATFPTYGKLSGYTQEQMLVIAKERGGDIDDKKKKDPLDFVLWKKSLPDEPFWDSPWGKGRPGWHIECSAMIHQYLGDTITIHGGGRDLIFPHHESEIAQSESYSGKSPFVSFWMHAAMVMYQGEKMSKSLKNLVLVKDLLKTHDPDTIRYVLLSHHYRTPWEFHEEQLSEAKKSLSSIKKALAHKTDTTLPVLANKTFEEAFMHAVDDDMHVPLALTVLSKLAAAIQAKQKTHNVAHIQKTLHTLSSLLGFTSL